MKKLSFSTIVFLSFLINQTAFSTEISFIAENNRDNSFSTTSHPMEIEQNILEEEYRTILKSFSKDRKTAVEQMKNLAIVKNYEGAQTYLAECYSMGIFGKSDMKEAIRFNKLAIDKNNSFTAAISLANIYWATGDYEEAKKTCEEAKKIAANKNLEFREIEINHLLKRIKNDSI